MPMANEDVEKTPITVVTGFLGVSTCSVLLFDDSFPFVDMSVALTPLMSFWSLLTMDFCFFSNNYSFLPIPTH